MMEKTECLYVTAAEGKPDNVKGRLSKDSVTAFISDGEELLNALELKAGDFPDSTSNFNRLDGTFRGNSENFNAVFVDVVQLERVLKAFKRAKVERVLVCAAKNNPLFVCAPKVRGVGRVEACIAPVVETDEVF